MAKYRRITVEWSYPVEINSILQKESMNDIGIYYISRKFGEKQSILYIGKTTYNFWSRLESHNNDWLNTYRGKKYVRLGRIVSPTHISKEELNGLINDTEKTMIYYLSNIDGYELPANISPPCPQRHSNSNLPHAALLEQHFTHTPQYHKSASPNLPNPNKDL